MKDWKDTGNDCNYYYDVETGLIVAQIHQIAHTRIWLAKCYLSYNDEHYLGQYINNEFAKKSVERFWAVRERTLEHSA